MPNVEPNSIIGAMSDVVFTVDPNTGGNYYIVNYDKSGSTDSVTSGEGENLSAHYIFRGFKSNDEYLSSLIKMADELITLFNKNEIDIEFAFLQQENCFCYKLVL